MSEGEFALLRRYFQPRRFQHGKQGVELVQGIGDDAAILGCPPGRQWVLSVDTLCSGVHFPAEAPAADIAHRALAVNLSDLAAMGAEAAGFTLALSLPEAQPAWLEEFSSALAQSARRHHLDLVGGDLGQGPLSLTLQVHGLVEPGRALLRSGAQPGDLIYVSGTLGDAAGALALNYLGQSNGEADHDYLRSRFYRPVPRLELGRALGGLASAAIDISDGLLADLGQILHCSEAGAELEPEAIPLSSSLRRCLGDSRARQTAMEGGDDYELCFTIHPQREHQLPVLANTPLQRIGRIIDTPGLHALEENRRRPLRPRGWQHFANQPKAP